MGPLLNLSGSNGAGLLSNGFDHGDVGDEAPAIALVGQEAAKDRVATDSQLLQFLGHVAHRDRLDLERDLARLAGFDDFGLGLEAGVQGHQPGGCVANLTELLDLRRQRKLVHASAVLLENLVLAMGRVQAASCCGALRASSRSTAFIMTEGVVMALS